MNDEHIIEWAKLFLKNTLEIAEIDEGHGIDHAMAVLKHAENALLDEKFRNLERDQILAVRLAALLHDADDRKFFGKNSNNVANILDSIYGATRDNGKGIKYLVYHMISLVSCSKNRNSKFKDTFMLIPRWADRLEATGDIGIKRAIIYNDFYGREIITPKTPIARDEKQLWDIATVDRFEKYKGVSESLLDHMYDKVLHISVETGIPYFDEQFKIKEKEVVDFCLEFATKDKDEIVARYR